MVRLAKKQFELERVAGIRQCLLVFYNVRNKDDTKQTEVLDVLEVIPNADFKYETKDNMHVFKGSENALSLTREYSVEWKCEYVYHWYPFDTQVGVIALLSSK